MKFFSILFSKANRKQNASLKKALKVRYSLSWRPGTNLKIISWSFWSDLKKWNRIKNRASEERVGGSVLLLGKRELCSINNCYLCDETNTSCLLQADLSQVHMHWSIDNFFLRSIFHFIACDHLTYHKTNLISTSAFISVFHIEFVNDCSKTVRERNNFPLSNSPKDSTTKGQTWRCNSAKHYLPSNK